MLAFNNGGWRLKKPSAHFLCVFVIDVYEWEKIEFKRLYIECLGCLSCLSLEEFILVSLKEYVIPLACIFVCIIESMLREQVEGCLLGLLSFTHGVYCIMVIDTLTEAV